jgi:hypothetical protein
MRLIYKLFLLLFYQLTFGQKVNMALNGSCESISDCPSGQGDIDLAYDFYRYGSVDLFSVCGERDFGVPENALGNQWSADGYSMAGMIVSTNGYWYYEYLIGTLDTSKMIDGEEYCLSVKVSLAENSPYSINQLAFFFSEFRATKALYNDNGFTRRVILPMLNYDDRYNNPPGGRYSSGSNSYITPLTISPSSPNNSGWVTIKNTIVYQKEHDYYFWIGGNSRESSVFKLENDNQNVFNPDRTAYYYLDDIKITKVESDTQSLTPKLYADCDKVEYVIDILGDFENTVCYSDSQVLNVLVGNRASFPLNTAFENIRIEAGYSEYCDKIIYTVKPPSEKLKESVLNTIYPNPTSETVKYNTVSQKDNHPIVVEVIDAAGKQVKEMKYTLQRGLNTLTLKVSDLSAGLYLFNFVNTECPSVQKVVIYNR